MLAPARFGLAAENAQTRTRRIEQDGVGVGRSAHHRRVRRHERDDGNPRRFEPRCVLGDLASIGVDRQQRTALTDARGNLQRLVSAPAAQLDDARAGLRVEQIDRKSRRLSVQVPATLSERLDRARRDAGIQNQDVGRERTRRRREPRLREDALRVVARQTPSIDDDAGRRRRVDTGQDRL